MRNAKQTAALNAALVDARGTITTDNGFHKSTLESLARAGLLERRGLVFRQGANRMAYAITTAGRAETGAA